MERNTRQKFVIHVVPSTWIGRVCAAAVALVLLLLAILFFAFVAIGASILALILIARAILLPRSSKRRAYGDVIDVEYSVNTARESQRRISSDFSGDRQDRSSGR